MSRPPYVQMAVRVPRELKDRLEQAAAREGLHASELLGGWPGALLAQQALRHKTRKVSFQLSFWAIVAIHQLFWIDHLLLNGRWLGSAVAPLLR